MGYFLSRLVARAQPAELSDDQLNDASVGEEVAFYYNKIAFRYAEQADPPSAEIQTSETKVRIERLGRE